MKMTNGRDGLLAAKQHTYYGGDQLISDRIKAPYIEENTRVVVEILSRTHGWAVHRLQGGAC